MKTIEKWFIILVVVGSVLGAVWLLRKGFDAAGFINP